MMVGRMKFIVRNYIAHIARRKYSDTIVNDLSRIFCWDENKAAMNSAEHRDDSIASPAKRMRLQERPTDQHAARGKCDHKDNELRKISTNKPQRYVRSNSTE